MATRTRREKIKITGMTCPNCEKRIERKLSRTGGVVKASVSLADSTLDVTYEPDKVSRDDIVKAVKDLGYGVQDEERARWPGLARTAVILAVITAAYVLLEATGVLELLVPGTLADSSMGYGMLFVTGLLTSVHCIAMCGGINLSQSLPSREAPQPGRQALLPSLMYNLGRICSYTVIGAVLGTAGMILGLAGIGSSGFIQGIVKIAAGVLMVFMAANMLDLSPFFKKLTSGIYSRLVPARRRQGSSDRPRVRKGPFLVGILNGFMPCGPLQAMWLLALASANPLYGALSMLAFGLGTLPLMLGLGGIVSLLGRRYTDKVMTAGAVLVAVMGFAMLSQGAALSGLLTPASVLAVVVIFDLFCLLMNADSKIIRRSAAIASACAIVIVYAAGQFYTGSSTYTSADASADAYADDADVEAVQVVESTLQSRTYPDIEVKAGTEVQWVIYADASVLTVCNRVMYIDEFDIQYTLTAGENIITFTPQETGTYRYTCWMGMITGTITVT